MSDETTFNVTGKYRVVLVVSSGSCSDGLAVEEISTKSSCVISRNVASC